MSSFKDTAEEIGNLVTLKNEAYGSAFERAGEIMNILFPDGITPHQMTDALAIVRVLDKFFRIGARKNAFDESPWEDVAGYGILMATLDKKRARQSNSVGGPDLSVNDRVIGRDANTGEPIKLEDVKFIRSSGSGAAVEMSRFPFEIPQGTPASELRKELFGEDPGPCECICGSWDPVPEMDAIQLWYEENAEILPVRYGGHNIAVGPDGVVASSPDLEVLLRQLDECEIDRDAVVLDYIAPLIDGRRIQASQEDIGEQFPPETMNDEQIPIEAYNDDPEATEQSIRVIIDEECLKLMKEQPVDQSKEALNECQRVAVAMRRQIRGDA